MHYPDLISPLAIAPMIDWTYSHFRVFLRLLLPNALLYTEMQTEGAVLNNPQRSLEHYSIEYPLALQLGGSSPQKLAECAKRGEHAGFNEINLNLGCPSDKVQAGQFGACLMKNAELVKHCLHALNEATTLPVTAKIRLGVDELDSYAFFSDFAHGLVEAGVKKLVVHARKAWLTGLNPKQNRTIPPINYDYVYQLREEISDIPLVINGNITSTDAMIDHLNKVAGVMIGRLACDNPYALTEIHKKLYPEITLLTRAEAFRAYKNHLLTHYESGISLGVLLKPLFNLAHGLPGAVNYRRELTQLLQTRSLSNLNRLIDWLMQAAGREHQSLNS